MRNAKQNRRGISSVLALLYLTLLAAMAVGFYSAIDVGTSLADNHQSINRSAANAESGMAFGRYQMDHVTLPGGTLQANALTATLTALQTNLNNSSNMGGNNPNMVTYNGGNAIAIPGQPAGWSWSGNGALPSNTNWMSTDTNGGNAIVLITQPNLAAYDLSVASVGQNSNNVARSLTPITRSLKLSLGGTQGTGSTTTSVNPIFNYGMVSYGEIVLNANVTVNGTNAGVLAVPKDNVTKPIQVNSTGSISSDFYWANPVAENAITWGSLSVDGYLSSNSNFASHVHGGIAPPTAPTYDTTVFTPYVTAQNPGSSTTVLTNASLPNKVGGYTFNKPLTINGILYLQSGAKVTFNSGVTVNGAIVQDNAATSGSVTFNSSVAQQAMPTGFAPGEEALTGTFLLLPKGTATFNSTTTAIGSIIANGMTVNSSLTVNGGSIINLGTGNMQFNSGSTLTVNTNVGSSPAGVQNITTPVSGPVTYSATANTYQEVGQ
jgi:hypothetical protein